MCLVKFNSSGHYQWSRTWISIDEECARGIAIDSSNNIYLAGYTSNTTSGNLDICLVKFNSTGHYLWNRTLGGSSDDQAFQMVLDSSENVYLSGFITNTSGAVYHEDMCLVKYNNIGQYQWNRTWDGGYNDFATTIALDSSENIYIGGDTYNPSFPSFDTCLVKFDITGTYK